MDVTPERWQHVARIYELAVEQDPVSRDDFLSSACEGDDALRREVESLLRQDDASTHPGSIGLGNSRSAARRRSTSSGRVSCWVRTASKAFLVLAAWDESSAPPTPGSVAWWPSRCLRAGRAFDQQMRARFSREARAVAALTHPHICTLYDVGSHDQLDYLVMEYLEGETLASRLKNGPLGLTLALAHAIEIASALEQAHSHGIIHRDLKPGNIMLTSRGSKLLDFGLAKLRIAGAAGAADVDVTRADTRAGTSGQKVFESSEGDDAPMTGAGAILGTVRYMAPEQFEGTDIDARSDLFAFGAVLHEMLTGKRAFEGDDASSVRAAIIGREPPSVSSLQPSVPPALDDVVRRCLAKDPGQRWPSAGDVLRELGQISESTHVGRTRSRAASLWIAAVLVASIAGVVRVVAARRVRARVSRGAGQPDSLDRRTAPRRSLRRP